VYLLGDRPPEPVVIQDHIILSAGATMTGKNVTRVELAAAIYEKVKLSRSESSALVDLVLDEIADTLVNGETVKLSSFGSFVVRKKGQRIGRNPKTGTVVPISPRRVVVFKPSAVLKQQVNRKRSATTKHAEMGSSAPAQSLPR
jgi:integration host factor subunit alpha